MLTFTPTDGDDYLVCPKCGYQDTHIDDVQVHAASGEGVTVSATGEDDGSNLYIRPVASAPKWGNHRRHAITLIGTCEAGCSFSYQFVQHKGSTYIELV